jgi:hypothetical protein
MIYSKDRKMQPDVCVESGSTRRSGRVLPVIDVTVGFLRMGYGGCFTVLDMHYVVSHPTVEPWL